MLTLHLLQIIIPLGFIAWIAFVPARSVVGFGIQAAAAAIALFALARVGLWLFPPWWAPYAFGVMLAVAIVHTLVRRRPERAWPGSIIGWGLATSFGALALFAANESRLAFSASLTPPGETIALSSPLRAGSYLVANGGTTVSVNAHADALDQSIPAHRAWRGTAYGVDIVAVDAWGLRASGVMPKDPHLYRIFGAPVVAPCAGDVIIVVDGLPDMQVPEVDERHLVGNHIVLRCQGADIVLAHFRQASVRVRQGDRLAVGALIAEVGNSGASSEPHLHIHAQTPGTVQEPISGAPIPMLIGGRFLVRSDRLQL